MTMSSHGFHHTRRRIHVPLLVLLFFSTAVLGELRADTPQSPAAEAQLPESTAPARQDVAPQTGPAIPSVSDTTRSIAERGLTVDLKDGPESEELEWEVEKGAERFPLPFGESPALLVRLPDYKVPYTLVIRSYPLKGFRKAIFVPTVMFFDSSFQPTADLAETAFKYSQMGFGRSHFEAAVAIDDSRRADRYALVFTDGRQLGETVRSALGSSLLIPNSIHRSYLGDVRLEVMAGK